MGSTGLACLFLCTLTVGSVLSFPQRVRRHPVCGEHPLRAVAEKLGHGVGSQLSKELMREKMKSLKIQRPEIFAAYQAAMGEYAECVLMSEGGHFGR